MEFFSLVSKFKKYHKLKVIKINRFSHLIFGNIGLRAIQGLKLTILNLKFFFKLLKKLIKQFNKKMIIKFKYFPHVSITKKPKDIRMGRGKGIVVEKVCYIKKGSIFLEFIGYIDNFIIKNILCFISAKLAILCRIVLKNNND